MLVAAATAVGAIVTITPAAAAPTNIIQNNSLETLGPDGFPECFEKSGWGDNDHTFTVVPDSHSGTNAVQIDITRIASGDRKTMMLESGTCAPQVTEGTQYDLSVFYKSTTPNTVFTLFRHHETEGWQYWTDLSHLPVTATFTEATVRTPPVPPEIDRITWGVTIYGVGTLITDDYSMTDPNEPEPEPACTGSAEECASGSWQVLATESPARGIHAVVLHTGKVLLISGSGNDEEAFAAGDFTTALYDPATGGFESVPTPEDFFCAGHVQLADGRVLVMGGNKNYPSTVTGHGYEGLKTSYIFDPATETYTRTNDMNAGHWYPSATIMGNGDVLSFGGLGEDSSGTVAAERWSAAENRWLPLWQVNQTWSFWGLYPAMILMQDGRLFYSGSHVFGNGLPGTGASIFDYGSGLITDVPGLRNKDERDQSASVLLHPAQDQRVITVGGGNVDSNPDANRLVDIIDLKDPDPGYVPGPDLPQGTNEDGSPQVGDEGKMYLSTVLLPDGKVFETGGALHNRADAIFEASMFDPTTNTFTEDMATDPVHRGYHSVATLLPDGRVLAAGNNPGDGSFDNRVSLYSPPYLFASERPEITSVAQTQWGYGTTQTVEVDGPVASASLIRPAAVTHSSDPNQRSVDLPMAVDGTTLSLSVTSNPNMAPPGWYMLFVTDAAGIPSVAKWVRVS